jgi:hypothetical protein
MENYSERLIEPVGVFFHWWDSVRLPRNRTARTTTFGSSGGSINVARWLAFSKKWSVRF